MRTSNTTVDAGRLKTLAEKVNREHRHAQSSAQQAVKHAVEAGELLLKAKEAVGHGGFTKWIEENFEGKPRHARRYMRLAKAADQDRIDPDEVSSLTEAENMLRDQDAEPTREEYEPEVEGEEYDFSSQEEYEEYDFGSQEEYEEWNDEVQGGAAQEPELREPSEPEKKPERKRAWVAAPQEVGKEMPEVSRAGTGSASSVTSGTLWSLVAVLSLLSHPRHPTRSNTRAYSRQ